MRKFVCTLLFLFTTLTGLYAQVHFKLGPIAGLNSTDLNTNIKIPYAQQTIGSGIAVGVFARLEMDRWYIQPEFLYISESSTLTSLTTNNTAIAASDINFFVSGYNLNLLAGYELFKIGELANIRAFAGLGQLFNNNSPINIDGSQVYLINGSTNVIGGIGADILKFTADIRYIRSVTELYTSANSIETNVFLLSVGIKFF